MNVQIYTKNQARSIIRHASSTEKVAPFLQHRNPNVVNSAKFALKYRMKSALEIAEQPVGSATPVEVGQAAPIDPEIRALALKYEVPTEFVLTLLQEKGALDAVKRSLTSRKSALTRAAKAKAA